MALPDFRSGKSAGQRAATCVGSGRGPWWRSFMGAAPQVLGPRVNGRSPRHFPAPSAEISQASRTSGKPGTPSVGTGKVSAARSSSRRAGRERTENTALTLVGLHALHPGETTVFKSTRLITQTQKSHGLMHMISSAEQWAARRHADISRFSPRQPPAGH